MCHTLRLGIERLSFVRESCGPLLNVYSEHSCATGRCRVRGRWTAFVSLLRTLFLAKKRQHVADKAILWLNMKRHHR